MGPHYLDQKTRRRAIVLLDDHYSFKEEPEDQYLLAVIRALSAKGLQLYAHDIFGPVGKLIVHHHESWDRQQPAPSAWILDIELLLGRHLHEQVCDGIGLARYLRQQDIRRQNQRGEWLPIPILFLTKYGINDVVPCAQDAASDQPFLQRIRNEVQVGWRFFRKNWTDPSGLRVDEESVGGPVRSHTLDEFTDLVWRTAEGA